MSGGVDVRALVFEEQHAERRRRLVELVLAQIQVEDQISKAKREIKALEEEMEEIAREMLSPQLVMPLPEGTAAEEGDQERGMESSPCATCGGTGVDPARPGGSCPDCPGAIAGEAGETIDCTECGGVGFDYNRNQKVGCVECGGTGKLAVGRPPKEGAPPQAEEESE